MLDRMAAGRPLSGASSAMRRMSCEAHWQPSLRHSNSSTSVPISWTRTLVEEALLPETRRMARLVDDLLLLTHADERTHEFKSVEVDLDDIVYAESERVRTITKLTREVISDRRASGPAIRRRFCGWCATWSTTQSRMPARRFALSVVR